MWTEFYQANKMRVNMFMFCEIPSFSSPFIGEKFQ